MSDLARLGLRVESLEAEVGAMRLDKLAQKASTAERATDNLAAASRRGATATAQLSASAAKAANDYEDLAKAQAGMSVHHVRGAASAKLQAHEVANLGRQFADVGVMLASGQNPFMTLLQQGPQVADVFATASARGIGFKAVLTEIGAMAAPFMAVLGPIALVAGAIGGAFAISAQQINKENGESLKHLKLTEEQLERVKDKGVTMGDVLSGTFKTIGQAIMAVAGKELNAAKDAFGKFYQAAVDGAVNAAKGTVMAFGGAYGAVKATWSLLPAALGDLAVQAANATLGVIEKMINGAIDLINAVINRANAAAKSVGSKLQMATIGPVEIGEIANRWRGAGEVAGKAVVEGAKTGAAGAGKGFDATMELLEKNILKARDARAIKQGGKAKKGAKGAADPLEESELFKSVRLFEMASEARGKAADAEWEKIERLKAANSKLIEEHERMVERERRRLDVNGGAGEGDAVGAVRTVRAGRPGAEMERKQAAFEQIAEWEKIGVVNHEEAEAAKAEIDKRYASARLQNYGDFFGTLATLSTSKNKELAAIGKAAAIVTATIDGVLAVQKALATYPPPFNIAMAAAVGTVAAVNVAKIAGFERGGYTGDVGTKDVAGVVHGKEFVVNAQATARNRAMLEAINSGRPVPAMPTSRPTQAPANDSGRTIRIVTEPSRFFDTHVEEVAGNVAAPMARQAGMAAVRTSARQAPGVVAKHSRQRGR